MNKLVRAGLEAVVSIAVTLAIIIGAFSPMFGMDALLALSGVYYAIWAGIILVTHLAFARQRRHLRLSIGVGTGVVVMGVHLAMFLTGNIKVDINMVPVILHDFGLALIGMIVLNIVHLVVFRRRQPKQAAEQGAPVLSERVDDIPAPTQIDREPRQAKTA
jgi:purine-cytosine permease-like protein